MNKFLQTFLSFILVVSTFLGALPAAVQAETETDYIVNNNFEGSEWPTEPTTTTSESFGPSYIAQVYTNQGDAWEFNPQQNYTQIAADPIRENNKVVKMVDDQDGTTGQGGATRLINNTFTSQGSDQIAVIEFDFMGKEFGSGIRYRLMNKGGDTVIASLETSDGSLFYRTAAGREPLIDNLQTDSWYHVKATIDLRTKKYDVTVSGAGNSEVSNLDFYQPADEFGRLDINTGNSSTSTIFLDNVQIYNPEIPPAAPTAVTAEAGDQKAKLSWGTVSDADSYNIKRRTSTDGPYETIAENVTDFHYTDTGLTNGTAYYYVISSVNQVGEGLNSEIVEVTPAADRHLPETPEDYIIHDDFDGDGWPTEPTTENATTINDYIVEITTNQGQGWNFDPAENYAQITEDPLFASNKVMKLHDAQDGSTNEGGSTRVYNKEFPAVPNDTTVVAEFDFLAESIGSGSRFRLVNEGGDSTMVSVESTGENLVLRRADDSTVNLIEGIQSNTWYHIKITADMVLQKYDIEVSGGADAEMLAQPFYQLSENFGRLDINTGNSSTSTFYVDEVDVYEPSVVPTAPAGVEAKQGNAQIKLTWDQASGATSYNVKRSTSAEGPFTTIAENLTELQYHDTELTNGTTYYYVVSGVNNIGEGANSDSVSVTPSADIPLPAAPEVDVTERSASATISWNDVADADRYTIRRSTSKDRNYEVIADDWSETSYLDNSLTNGTTYYYTVQASGVGGDGPSSDAISVQPSEPLDRPAKLTAIEGNNKVELQWNAVEGASSYTVKRSTENGGPYEVITDDIQGATFTDDTASNGTDYYYVVSAHNNETESMNSVEVKATPYQVTEGAPAIPDGFDAKAHEGEAALSWNETADADTYTVKRSTEISGPYTTIAENVNTTLYTDSDVTNGTSYYYVVTASNENGNSGLSNELNVVPAEKIVVAKDGSGDFETIQAAVDSIPSDNDARKVIYIKNGTYKEKVHVTQPYVSFVGESADNTIIEWDDYGGTDGQSGNVGSTFKSQTVKVTGDHFTAAHITFLNSRAPRDQYGTAVALSVLSDQAVFTDIKALGLQDTLYTGEGRQYYRDSYIEGEVDFIFGEAPAVVFENSEIHSVGAGYITAGAQPEKENPGFVFLNSRLTKDDSVEEVYLGRPWKDFADTTFINTWMDSHIVPDGWKQWSGTDNHKVANYTEFNSAGPGANPEARVAWSKQLTAEEANALTVPRILNGWNPEEAAIILDGTEFDKDVTAPAKPEVNPVNDQSTTVTGTAEAGSTVKVTNEAEQIGEVNAGENGEFAISIDAQPAGTVLTITAADQAGNVSEEATVTVASTTDKDAPVWPENAELQASATEGYDPDVTLQWPEANDNEELSTYKIVVNDELAKEVDANHNQTKVSDLEPGANYQASVIAVDAAGNESKPLTVTVETEAVDVERVAGINRYETAVEISKEAYDEAETVVIARGDKFPDALAGTPLAHQAEAPILLTKTDELSEVTKEEIARLGAEKVIVLGGTNAIHENVSQTLEGMGLAVDRISGETRFETAALIAKRISSNPEKVIIANGRNFPDALTAAPYAARQVTPILLTEKDETTAATLEYAGLADETVVVGGERVITAETYEQFNNPVRISGDNRYGTAVEIAKYSEVTADEAFIATGNEFADALTGSILAAQQKTPLLLVDDEKIREETKNFIHKKEYMDFTILGGPAAVPENVEETLEH
ncbi:pectinesterase family protein [Bacillus salacetis]|uniref:pectinesterase family protein n=1 Tax=Bacillus salacetis TaxID=2315464 RepID=UPI003BA24DAC